MQVGPYLHHLLALGVRHMVSEDSGPHIDAPYGVTLSSKSCLLRTTNTRVLSVERG